ncbi:MAG TPA: BrnA antitoxin family protein [Caulobacteraceae bacterium]|jgi:uncharacterized protein (DUF4415 family)|nr:BrnA antitoxin family protein [Caulobacteraceae bacterium]
MSERVVRVPVGKPLTEAQERRIVELAESDAPIDYSDIPPLDEAFWTRAVRNPFYRPVKSQLTVRIDSDVLAWLKGQGRGYQTRINAILRRAMLDEVVSK